MMRPVQGMMRWRRILTGLAASLVGLVCALTPATSEAQGVIPPGHEAAFVRLLGPELRAGEAVWQVRGVAIQQDHVEYRLEDAGSEVLVLLRRRETTTAPWFVVEVRPDDPSLQEVVALATRNWQGPSPFVDARSERARSLDSSRAYVEPARASSGAMRLAALGGLAFFLVLLWVGRLPALVVLGVGIASMAVVAHAWMADDATITFRTLDHAWAGHGLVFNIGERVQGFTHPLWLVITLPFAGWFGPVEGAWCCSVVCSVFAWAWVSRAVCADARGQRGKVDVGSALLVLAMCCASESLVVFSASGLEDPLTHALLAALLLVRFSGDHPERLVPVAIALLWTRLDLALIVVPVVLEASWTTGTWRYLKRSGAAGAVMAFGLFAWLVFATLYYGSPLPNTFFAKTAGGPELARGLRYLVDFGAHEPLAGWILVLGIAAGLRSDDTRVRAASWGGLLSIAYVVYVGGDYMRGRFLTAPYWIACAVLVRELGAARARRLLPVMVAFAALSLGLVDRAANEEIVNERAFHPESHIDRLVDGETHPNPMMGDPTGAALGATVMARAFSDDPRLAYIDGHGLTDAFIARCPALPDGRAGHLERLVPEAYFAYRGDVRLLRDGEARLRAGESALAYELETLRQSAEFSPEVSARLELVRLMTEAPVFSWQRLSRIPEFVFTWSPVPVERTRTHLAPP